MWAAFGAPLLGVPALVGLLALGAPGSDSGTAVEVEAAHAVEAPEVVPVDRSVAAEVEGAEATAPFRS